MAEETMQRTSETPQQLQRIIETAFAEAPALYANGFVNGLGLTDSYLVLQANGRSVAVVNMSLSVAKTLGQSLLAMVESFEQATGQEVSTLDQIQNQSQQ